jgi:hypothetical protein
MEIITLRFVVTEDDLNSLLVNFVTFPPKLRNLRLRVIPNGFSLSGVYDAILPIPFNTEWRNFVENGKIGAQLSRIKAVGVRVDFLKSYVLKALSSNSTVLELNAERLLFDVDRFLDEMAVPIKTNLSAVFCDSGCLVIECGGQASSTVV